MGYLTAERWIPRILFWESARGAETQAQANALSLSPPATQAANTFLMDKWSLRIRSLITGMSPYSYDVPSALVAPASHAKVSYISATMRNSAQGSGSSNEVQHQLFPSSSGGPYMLLFETPTPTGNAAGQNLHNYGNPSVFDFPNS